MNVENLPVPQVDATFHPSHATTVARVLGVAMLAIWILPFGKGPAMVWNVVGGFPMIWLLLSGVALTVFSFVPQVREMLKKGHVLAIFGGIGAMGILSISLGGWLFFGLFGVIGLTAGAFGLLHWARHGYSQLAWTIAVVGVGFIGLSLLVPVGRSFGGGAIPLIDIFTQFGGGGFILTKIFLFIVALAYIGLGVLTVLFVILKKETAELTMVRFLGNLMFWFILAGLAIISFFSIFASAMAFSIMFKTALVTTAYIYLTLWSGLQMFELNQRGELAKMF